MEKKLKFREDGTFVIVQFSDVEFIDAEDLDPETPLLDSMTKATMERVIAIEQPDLVVFAGDLTASARSKDPLQSFRSAVAVAEENRVAWAAVFGNHDSEGSVPRIRMHEEQLLHEYCAAKPEPPDVSGAGNYVLTVDDSKGRPAASLFFLDSGDYSPMDAVGGYDWIRRDQIEWYASESRQLAERNGGEPLPALAFFHIPLPEYKEVWKTKVCEGHCSEWISSPELNSGLFAAMVEMGDVMGTFVGHDHSNDYCGTLHGIRLCYGRSTRYVSYVDGVRKDKFPTGARVIRLRVDERQFETWIRQSDGLVAEMPLHEPDAL
ncbi:metallophosphoesterase family protein [Paenibacillus sp. p3-SID867]|uniref:metallophosphoesterase family protein n=1 Tax=Paenibacillus sp. p3-SID867 TaxID=2916363 RepID=UPI0021A7317D|nr:metallophosphoesterase family protein [Paenibacillus sp. p3-SID867]MCT1402137.1 metallophosphoesterase family protein [Paenibacillus sp. p3-SID867]